MDHLARLLAIVTRLRGPDGCPWDRKQTHASLRGCVIEEAYEVAEAIDAIALGDPAPLREELGDLLLQVALHAEIASETGTFTFEDVARELGEKLIRRHPHVFGENGADRPQADHAEAVVGIWEAVKRQERGGEKPASALDGVSKGLPALLHAEKVTKRAARVGFDWATPEQVSAKVTEELAEVEEVLADQAGPERVEEEVGDLLFAVVNLARKAGVNPEVALSRATHKFTRRFHRVEAVLREKGSTPEASTLEEMDAIWDSIKHKA